MHSSCFCVLFHLYRLLFWSDTSYQGSHACRNCFWLFFLILQYYSTVEPHLTTTLLIWPPQYYGHFILAWKKAQSDNFLLKNPFWYDHPVNTTHFPWLEGGRSNRVPLCCKFLVILVFKKIHIIMIYFVVCLF